MDIATAVTFQQVSGLQLEPVEMALPGQKAENEFVNVKTGIPRQIYFVTASTGAGGLSFDKYTVGADNTNIITKEKLK